MEQGKDSTAELLLLIRFPNVHHKAKAKSQKLTWISCGGRDLNTWTLLSPSQALQQEAGLEDQRLKLALESGMWELQAASLASAQCRPMTVSLDGTLPSPEVRAVFLSSVEVLEMKVSGGFVGPSVLR